MASKPKTTIRRVGKDETVRVDISVPRGCSASQARKLIAQRCHRHGLGFNVRARTRSVRITIISIVKPGDLRVDSLALEAEKCVEETRKTS